MVYFSFLQVPIFLQFGFCWYEIRSKTTLELSRTTLIIPADSCFLARLPYVTTKQTHFEYFQDNNFFQIEWKHGSFVWLNPSYFISSGSLVFLSNNNKS